MTEVDYARTLDELDRLLNDPNVPMAPDRVWSLLADIAAYECGDIAGQRPIVRAAA